MRTFSYTFGILVLFFFMLLFPQTITESASGGLLLWFQVLVPALLPFMMISRLLIKSNLTSRISSLFYPILGHFFGTNRSGSYCILCGFLCGYPMGAKVIADLYEERTLSKQHAEYLLCFCNNVSPGFVQGFIIYSCLRKPELLPVTLCILYGIPAVFSFVLRILFHPLEDSDPTEDLHNAPITFYSLNDCIMNSLASIGMLGGYVIIFRILSGLFQLLPFFSMPVKSMISACLEITSGIPLILENAGSFSSAYSRILLCTSFGGLSGIAQTSGMVRKYGFSMKRYTLSKLFQALLAGAAGWLYMNL